MEKQTDVHKLNIRRTATKNCPQRSDIATGTPWNIHKATPFGHVTNQRSVKECARKSVSKTRCIHNVPSIIGTLLPGSQRRSWSETDCGKRTLSHHGRGWHLPQAKYITPVNVRLVARSRRQRQLSRALPFLSSNSPIFGSSPSSPYSSFLPPHLPWSLALLQVLFRFGVEDAGHSKVTGDAEAHQNSATVTRSSYERVASISRSKKRRLPGRGPRTRGTIAGSSTRAASAGCVALPPYSSDPFHHDDCPLLLLWLARSAKSSSRTLGLSGPLPPRGRRRRPHQVTGDVGTNRNAYNNAKIKEREGREHLEGRQSFSAVADGYTQPQRPPQPPLVLGRLQNSCCARLDLLCCNQLLDPTKYLRE